MSEARESAVPSRVSYHVDLPIAEDSALPVSSSPKLRLGGGLGIAACVVGLIVFLAACAGFEKALVLSVIPILLGAVGLVLSLWGAFAEKDLISEDTHVLQALFVGAIGVIGGLLQMAAWQGWMIFPK